MRHTPRASLLVLLAAGLLAGCGFRLQGAASLPPVLASAYVDPSDSQSDFYLGLRSALRGAGTTLAPQGGESVATIRILADGASERVLTVSAGNIPTAYTLSYTVRIAVSAGGRELIAPEDHTMAREYSFDRTALLSKEREREALTAALADELVTQVMRRLASLSSAP
jgi:LPS-assembly lipoprotein